MYNERDFCSTFVGLVLSSFQTLVSLTFIQLKVDQICCTGNKDGILNIQGLSHLPGKNHNDPKLSHNEHS